MDIYNLWSVVGPLSASGITVRQRKYPFYNKKSQQSVYSTQRCPVVTAVAQIWSSTPSGTPLTQRTLESCFVGSGYRYSNFSVKCSTSYLEALRSLNPTPPLWKVKEIISQDVHRENSQVSHSFC